MDFPDEKDRRKANLFHSFISCAASAVEGRIVVSKDTFLPMATIRPLLLSANLITAL